MDDIKLAMLGNKEAAKRLTETYSVAALAVGGHRMLKHRSARGAAQQ